MAPLKDRKFYRIIDARRTENGRYIAALMVDEELADQVWENWDAGTLNDTAAFIAWMLIILSN